MWAGGRVWVRGALRVGERALRESRIADISVKQGSQGRLVFVLVEHCYSDPSGVQLLREEQDIVYRDPPVEGVQPREHHPPEASEWSRSVVPDPVLLFRYAALTFNAHRIHYDRDWAVQQEGYPGLVVQGPLTATLLLDLLYRKQPDRQVTEFSFRGLSPLFELAAFELHGVSDEGSAGLWAETPGHALAMTLDCKLSAAVDRR
jgi:3-methylfumaryl-CoA hydratase